MSDDFNHDMLGSIDTPVEFWPVESGIDWTTSTEEMQRFSEWLLSKGGIPRQETHGEWLTPQCPEVGKECSEFGPDGRCTRCGRWEHPEEHHVRFAFDPERPGWTTPIYDVNGDKVSDGVPIDSIRRVDH